ncbi:MAG: glycosyltransferase family 4 protein [Rikenellaceae bacterium]|jgi:UDP-N-acetylmuramyl pentapeptide phosphotransferase/UDP-N-acetylglucosamine-1-phosphate transferase|nr:glycosyltransferase family 4 protein [Rikenellaceae bacterium]
MNIFLLYALITILLVLLELLYFRIADRFDIIDKPNLRSSHSHITLRGGGVIFLLGAWLWAAFFGVHYPWFLAGLTAISVISFIDDARSVPNSARLVVQFAAMFMMFYQFGILNIESWWIILVALVVGVGIINAYNFMDGVNGITGGYSLAVLIPLIYINSRMPFIEMSLLYVVGLSLLVFCFFNFRKQAKCFAGDVGAISIAFILIFLLGRLILTTGDFTYILFLAIYGVDSILTIIHRIMLKEPLGQAHRKHAYQLMANELRMSHITVSSIFMAMQLVVSFGLIWLPVSHWLYMVVVLVVLCAAYLAFMKRNYHLHEAYLKAKQ